MNLKEAMELQDYMHNVKKEIRKLKGHDYATDANVHENFDVLAKICELLKVDITKPWGVAMYYKLLKIQRECNLVFGDKEPKNETFLDTLLDGSNYDDLRLEIYVREGMIKYEME